MYRLTKDPDILLCIETGAFIPRDHYLWPTKWLESNTPLPVPPPYELHSPEHYRVIRAAAWDWMAAEVHERGYDSIETCVGYYNSSVDRYRLEARARWWRGAMP